MTTKGGKRVGAGRKPKAIKALQKASAELILTEHDEFKLWNAVFQDGDPRLVLDALKYLTDRRDGKAAQAVDMNMSGEVRVISRVICDL